MYYLLTYCLARPVKDRNLIFLALALFVTSFAFGQKPQEAARIITDAEVRNGAERTEIYLPLLQGKAIAIVANQTSLIENTHLVDTLLALGVNVKKVFAPEHGFRGGADAGEQVKDYKDKKTSLPIISLYGKNKKPSPADLKDIEVVIFDIQDVGVRYYTYISTMYYVMEACAENNKQFILLDRPNPNGFFIDGPVLEDKYRSFVGVHNVPLVHGMTIAEYAKMTNEEGWLKNGVKCKIEYILCEGYTHRDFYQLPVKPSPNLPNMDAVYLYPSLGLFEGTVVSVGRGTEKPFQLIGHPELKNTTLDFTPKSMPGASNPPYENELCHGFDLSGLGEKVREQKKIYLYWLIGTYKNSSNPENYFISNGFFNLLAGNAALKKQVEEGLSEKQIRESWQKGLDNFREIRRKYMLYEDFE